MEAVAPVVDVNAVEVTSPAGEVVATLIPDAVQSETLLGVMQAANEAAAPPRRTIEIEPTSEAVAKEKALEDAKQDLRDTWKFGEGWRLDFGRKLNQYRPLFGYGKWVKFVEDEFGLHRMTACRWIKAALKEDGWPEDKEVNEFDVPNARAEDIKRLIKKAQQEAQDNPPDVGPLSYRVVIPNITEDEKKRYQKRLLHEPDFVKNVFKKAWLEVVGEATTIVSEVEVVGD
jgi:hypothetical protein